MLEQYIKAPEITRTRHYQETMGDVLPYIGSKIIIDDSMKQLLPILPLSIKPPEAQMDKRGCFWMLAIAGMRLLFRGVLGCFYAVNQTEQVIITQFGKPVGEPITDPGLHFKLPFIQDVNRIDKRFLEWDGAPVAIPTRDKTYIHVDTFARWRIDDPDLFCASERRTQHASRASETSWAVKRATPSPNTT